MYFDWDYSIYWIPNEIECDKSNQFHTQTIPEYIPN